MKLHGLDTFILVALASVLCLGAIGCGGGEESPEQSRQTSDVQEQEQGSGDSVAKGGDGGDGKNGQDGEDGESVVSEGGSSSSSQSSTVTQSGNGDQVASVQQLDGSNPSSSSVSSGPDGNARTITGDGDTSVSFDVSKKSRFVWISDQGKVFSARGSGLSIESRGGRGEELIGPGKKDLRVNGSNWTIVIRPAG